MNRENKIKVENKIQDSILETESKIKEYKDLTKPISPENAIVLSGDFVSLKAIGQYQIEFTNLPATNQMDKFYEGGMFGEERRFIASIGYRTSLYINSVSSWLFEIGGTATGTQVIRNYFVFRNGTMQFFVKNNAHNAPRNSGSGDMQFLFERKVILMATDPGKASWTPRASSLTPEIKACLITCWG